LEASGYSRDTIVMEDITELCFDKLAQFLDRREKGLGKVGIHSLEQFQMVRRMLRWFAKDQVLREHA
jgi:hypothetical protein